MGQQQRSLEGTVYETSDRVGQRGTLGDWDNAKKWFPERSVQDWMGLFERAPHIMHSILGDIYREVKAQQEKDAGRVRTGRRPNVINGNLAELHQIITPQFSTKPFPQALTDLRGKTSLRAFAARMGTRHGTLRRYITGVSKLDRYILEQAAAAGRVSPAYFAEYREAEIVEAFTAFLHAKPNMNIKIFKEIQRHKGQPS